MVAPLTIAAGISAATNIISLQASNLVLAKQAEVYAQNAKALRAEGSANADKVMASGRAYIGEMYANTAGRGIDVDSAMVQNNERVVQKGVNDDVFATMYSAAKAAQAQEYAAQSAKDQMFSNDLQSIASIAGLAGALFLL